MRFALFLPFLILAVNASFADDIGGGGAADLLYKTNINLDAPVEKPRLHVGMICTDTSGAKYTPNDSGYDKCIRSANDTQVRGTDADPTHPQTGEGISYKFGNRQ